MTNSTTTPGSKVGRARRSLGQLWQVPTFLVGLSALIGVAASAPWRLSPQEREFTDLVNTLRDGLESGATGDPLVGMAENVNLRLARFPAHAAEAHFLIGSAYYRQAQQKPTAAKELWPRVAEHLEKALALGGHDKDRAALQYRLGYALYQQNLDVARALDLMTLTVEKGAEQPLVGYQLILQAHLKRTPPNVEAALSAMRRILDLTPERDTEALANARLQHAGLLLRKEARADAIKELERIGPKTSRGVRLKARLLQARCLEEDGQWSKAIPIWQQLRADAAQIEGGRARIAYALGWCYHQLETPKYAEAISAWSEALKLGGPEGQAAGLHLGRLRLDSAMGDAGQALADWKTALEKVSEPRDYRNPYIPIEQVRAWFDSAIAKFQEAQDPEKTQAVAELYRKIAPGGDAELKIAQAAEAVARLKAEQLKAPNTNVTWAEVQARYRRAGEAYELAAGARTEADRDDALWRSIQCYLLAKDGRLALPILHQVVKMKLPEQRLAEAWHSLGDLYRLDGKKDFAHEAYVKCLEYPNTPFAYRSRYFLALEEEIDRQNFEKARDILKDNLLQGVDVERTWQEKSAFKMASLLMKMKIYGEAQIHLKECLRLYPESPNGLLAKEQLGECYRKLADAERLKEEELRAMIKVGLSDERRLTLEESVRQQHRTRIDYLILARKTYQELADDLGRTFTRTKQLSNLEQILLRRARFGIGECHLDNEEYIDALGVFTELQTKHRKTLEGFYASLRICNLVPIVRQPADQAEVRASAKASVVMLLEDLKALPDDHELFRIPLASSRKEWLFWAADTQVKLLTPPRVEKPAFP